MNEFLAEMYGTRQSIGATQDNTDVEKLAEAQLLDDALKAEGIDIDSLSGETILKLASEILGPDSELVKAAQQEKVAKPFEGKETAKEEQEEHKVLVDKAVKEMKDKKAAAEQPSETPATQPAQPAEETFEEKVAQADFLGRVMAHSYVQEMSHLEKDAGAGQAMKNWGQLAKHVAGKGAEKAKEVGKKVGDRAKTEFESAKKHRGALGILGATHAGAAAAGAGAMKAYHDKKKEGSAIEALAEKRANEWLQAHGLVQQEAATEPTDEEKLAAAVDQRAYELLKEAGVDVEAVQEEAAKAQAQAQK